MNIQRFRPVPSALPAVVLSTFVLGASTIEAQVGCIGQVCTHTSQGFIRDEQSRCSSDDACVYLENLLCTSMGDSAEYGADDFCRLASQGGPPCGCGNMVQSACVKDHGCVNGKCNATASVTATGTCQHAGNRAPAGKLDQSESMKRLPGGQLEIAWLPGSCGSAQDYGIYSGTLGTWYDHTLLDCHDDGNDFREVVTAPPGNCYFLVVPFNSTSEGSYGVSSAMVERPRGASTCVPSQVLQCP